MTDQEMLRRSQSIADLLDDECEAIAILAGAAVIVLARSKSAAERCVLFSSLIAGVSKGLTQ
jgi:hypothetical protein